jgi:Cu(I)/Ag(I) efflux system membrane fusion protein
MRFKSFLNRILWLLLLTLPLGTVIVTSCDRHDARKNENGQKNIIYQCPMHPTIMRPGPGTCPICHMDLVPVRGTIPDSTKESMPTGDSTGHFVKIDPSVVQNMGVRTEKAAIRELKRDIRTSAVVAPDERRTFVMTSKIMGYVEKLHANYTGFRVKDGDPLLELYSPDLVSGQTEYLSALDSRNQPGAEQLLASARQRLLNWDISPLQIEELEKRGAAQKTMTMASPVNGVVVEKMVTQGQSVEPGMTLFKIVDYSHVWVLGSIYQQDIPLIRLNQRADVLLDYYPGKKFSGAVVYIAPELDQASRTLQVRVDLANTPDLAVKPGMNATIVINSALALKTIAIPDQAVLHSGVRTLAIVSRGNGLFEPREITAGQSAEGYTQVKKGIRDGEEIVVSSQFLIDAESNLKAAVMSMAAHEGVGATPGDTSDVSQMERTPGSSTGKAPIPSGTTGKPAPGVVSYTCPMHPEIIRDKPGKCPLCKMDLVERKQGITHAQ